MAVLTHNLGGNAPDWRSSGNAGGSARALQLNWATPSMIRRSWHSVTRIWGASSGVKRFDEAEKLKVGPGREEQRAGKGSAATAPRLNALGLLFREQGRLEEAREILTRALELLGPDQGLAVTEAANIETNLGVVLADLGLLEEAGRMFESAVGREIRAYGRDDVRVAARLAVLAQRWEQIGHRERALSAARRRNRRSAPSCLQAPAPAGLHKLIRRLENQ